MLLGARAHEQLYTREKPGSSPAGLTDHQAALESELCREIRLVFWRAGGERFPRHSSSSDGVKLLLTEEPGKKGLLEQRREAACRSSNTQAEPELTPERHRSSPRGQTPHDKAGAPHPHHQAPRAVRKPQTSAAAATTETGHSTGACATGPATRAPSQAGAAARRSPPRRRQRRGRPRYARGCCSPGHGDAPGAPSSAHQTPLSPRNHQALRRQRALIENGSAPLRGTTLSRATLQQSGSSQSNHTPQKAGLSLWWAPLTFPQSAPGTAGALPE